MNLDNIIDKKWKKNRHSHHGGEIYGISNSLIDFSTNINPFATPEIYNEAYLHSINHISKYPDSKSIRLKKELVTYFKKNISIENIIIGAGSMELISLFCDMFINSGDDVIICQPTFSEYAWAIKKNGGNIINSYRKPEEYFRINPELVLNKVSHNTKAIFICNPNNPNGLLDYQEDIEKIIKYGSNNDILVFLDEAFIEFTGEINSLVKRISSFENLFISRSFTKFFGLTGLRIGFGISTPEIIDYISNGQILWPLNCIGQYVAQEILKSEEFIQKSINFFSEECEFMKSELKKINTIKVFPSNTNYFLLNIKPTGMKAAKLKNLLLDEKILIRDCSNYEGLDDYYIRICVKTRELNKKLIECLKNILQ